ncbi:twin-arginine translocation signal domain-containing protein [Breoghania sp. L-A4]|uniref:twin-arginine translocation signal domain-containing protein n=1 Tax=Breoghania sp. L-A4 TaxID=2304600 RepID=UPI0020BD9649|nr:twin-arginine translocation signal domain-containing protein [Breoghania sp. L-A4]
MTETLNRRRFLKGSALAATATAGTLAAPAIARAEPTVLKMQAAWAAASSSKTPSPM